MPSLFRKNSGAFRNGVAVFWHASNPHTKDNQ